MITWYINAHNGYDQQHLQSEVTLKCLADVITAWFQTTSPKYYLLPPFSQSLFLELICQFFLGRFVKVSGITSFPFTNSSVI